jgi:hypothetical protein
MNEKNEDMNKYKNFQKSSINNEESFYEDEESLTDYSKGIKLKFLFFRI